MDTTHIVLFVSTSCRLALCAIIAEDATKSDFVDLLKKDLRRNNDDYVETTAWALNVSNPYLVPATDEPLEPKVGNETQSAASPPPDTFYYRREAANDIVPAEGDKTQGSYRRHNIPRRSRKQAETNYTKTGTTDTLVEEEVMLTPVQPPIVKKKPTNDTDLFRFRSNSVRLPKLNEAKVDKFKRFISKNKELFSEFVKKRTQMEAKVIMQHEMLPVTRPPTPWIKQLAGLQQISARAQFRADKLAPLTADQLDMAPARGNKIHAMRIKGRLCDRSVLIPEGPKYDSRGRAYLAAYGHARGKDYARTRRPLRLPRCCNCCRKSLLGCE